MIQGRRIARNIELKLRNLQYCSLLLLRNSFFGFYSNASDSGAQIIQLIGVLLVELLGVNIVEGALLTNGKLGVMLSCH